MIPCTLLTAFIVINCYEIVFHKDLRYVYAVESFKSSSIIDDLIQANNPLFSKNQALFIQVHEPKSLNFPVLDSRLALVPAIKDGQAWLELSNKGQYIILNENGESGIGNMLVYLQRSWRTIDQPLKLAKDTKFSLEAKDYTNIYKVIEVKKKSFNDKFILNTLEKSYVLLIIEDKNTGINYFIKAVFVAQDRHI